MFSGIGGFALAAQWAGYRTIAFCERDEFCKAVLRKHWPGVPCEPDICKLDGTKYRGVDLLTGGFPCQPFSCAGKRRGKEDDRYLWPEMLRVIKEARPRWIVGENVAGIINLELDRCISDLEAAGYSVQAFVIPACAVDAKHRRDRVWIVAHSDSRGLSKPRICSEQPGRAEAIGASQDVADAGRAGQPCGRNRSGQEAISEMGNNRPSVGCKTLADVIQFLSDTNEPGSQGRGGDELSERGTERTARAGDSPNDERAIWPTEPDVGRVANGVSLRAHRIKSLGNAIVPQVAFEIIKAISEQND